MINAIQIALSGLNAAKNKIGASASNIANLSTEGALDPANGPAAYTPLTTVQTAQDNGGVQSQVVPSGKPFVPTYNPGSPFANGDGLVASPNVDLAGDIVNLQVASVSYKASLKTIQAESDMQSALLNMFDHKA